MVTNTRDGVKDHTYFIVSKALLRNLYSEEVLVILVSGLIAAPLTACVSSFTAPSIVAALGGIGGAVLFTGLLGLSICMGVIVIYVIGKTIYDYFHQR